MTLNATSGSRDQQVLSPLYPPATIDLCAEKDLVLDPTIRVGAVFRSMQFVTAQVIANSHHHYDKVIQDAVALSETDCGSVACKSQSFQSWFCVWCELRLTRGYGNILISTGTQSLSMRLCRLMLRLSFLGHAWK